MQGILDISSFSNFVSPQQDASYFKENQNQKPEPGTKPQGPHDRNFLVCITNKNFLRGATERNTR